MENKQNKIVTVAVLKQRRALLDAANLKAQEEIEKVESRVHKANMALEAARRKKFNLYKNRKFYLSDFAYEAEELGAIGVRVEDTSVVYVLPNNKVIRRWNTENSPMTPIIEDDV